MRKRKNTKKIEEQELDLELKLEDDATNNNDEELDLGLSLEDNEDVEKKEHLTLIIELKQRKNATIKVVV